MGKVLLADSRQTPRRAKNDSVGAVHEGEGMYENLQFRRQFLLSNAPVGPLAHWDRLEIGRYFLYTHPDLEVTRVADGHRTLVLLGNLFDSEQL